MRVRLIPLGQDQRVGWYDKPCLRTDLIFGPAERRGGATTYFVKDPRTNWFYSIGQKEYFLLRRMDGTRTLQEIGEDYARKFKRNLDQRAWEQIFRLVRQRLMLQGMDNWEEFEVQKKKAAEKKHRDNRKILQMRFPIFNPDALLHKLLPYVQFAFRPVFIVLTLSIILVLEIFILTRLEPLRADAWEAHRNVFTIVIFIALEWIFLGIHEVAHGLTCKKFGGAVTEIGLMWRYLFIFLYCKVDDVVLFHNRWHRVFTAFAGIYVNLLTLIPFGFLWLLLPGESMLKSISALMLFSFNLTTLLNFIPFVELDGYFMLSHALNRIDLRKESQLYWKRHFSVFILRREKGKGNYSGKDHLVYGLYGALSLLFTTAFLIGVSIFWFMLFRQWFLNIK